MNNYGHRFAAGSVCLFFISIGCILRNCFGIDILNFFEKIGIYQDIILAILACVTLGIGSVLDNLVEKYELGIEKRDRMYLSIMIGSIVIAALSFII